MKIITASGNSFPIQFSISGVLILAVQKLGPQTGSPKIFWLYVNLEFPLGPFTGFRAYANLSCQCQRHEKLGVSPEVLIFNENWKIKFKVKKKIRSVSVAIKAEDYVNRAVMGWSLSHALHEVPTMCQCSQVLTASISPMWMRRWLAPCRTAQPLFEKTGRKRVEAFPLSQMGCLSRALPCRKPCRKPRKFWAICHVVGSPPAAKAVRCMWCSHGTAKLGLRGFLLNHITNSTTCRRQLFASQIIKISHTIP